MSFWMQEVLPQVFHIEDALGVCMTLLAGTREAWLIDAGYGLEDVAAFVSSVTDKPVRLLLTHGHYDHALGARWFREAAIFQEDLPIVEEYTRRQWRKKVLQTAAEMQFELSEEDARDYLSAGMPVWRPLSEGTADPGGFSVRTILCPGHTPGSAVFYVPERRLLLTGDDWNPCTWLFFPEALPAKEYLANMNKLLALPFEQILCPHRRELYDRSMLEQFLEGLTDESLALAEPTDTGHFPDIQTVQAEPAPDQVLVFDRGKCPR